MKTYEAKYDPQKNKGVYGISLVENPAMEGLFIALSKEEEIQLKTIDEEKRIVVGLVLEPEKDIYRNQNGEEFYIRFSAETIKNLCYSFTRNQNNSNSTIEHNIQQKTQGVTFVENWLVRDEKMDTSIAFGLSPKKESWMSIATIDSDEVWSNYVKTGKVKGFSIDAMLSLEEVKLNSQIEMSKQDEKSFIELLKDLPNQIKLALTPKSEEVKLGSQMLKDGSLKIEWEGETLSEGLSVWVMADDGTKVAVPTGEHPLEDGTILIVEQEGIVKEVKPVEMPADPNAPVDAGVPEDGKVSNDAKIASEIESAIKSILIKYTAQEAKIEGLEKQTIELKEQIAEMGKQPSAKPLKNTKGTTEVSLSGMTAKERIYNTINKNKN